VSDSAVTLAALWQAVDRAPVPVKGSLAWRGVEAQHVVSTMRLVDSLAEQAILEQLLEASAHLLNMWVVGVVPRGLHQRPACQVSAAFSWAPAIEMRKSSASAPVWPGAVLTALSNCCSTPVSSKGSTSMRNRSPGV
jgi:hypothetical protein